MDEQVIMLSVRLLSSLEPQDLPDARAAFMQAQDDKGIPETEAAGKWEILLKRLEDWRNLARAAGD